ncbi:MAG: class I SAM-dependent methyltransferase [Clostridia bacterium]|nr:class I SAM-dependent methyltransferase [Clostridia bacterium]
MSYELKSARYLAAEYLRKILEPGDRAIDATMGNGHDTALLCSLVGSEGHVDAFDVQPAALESTKSLLEAEGLLSRASLYLLGHEHMAEAVNSPVKAIVFNLGWLPGGDHGVTTRVKTTLSAIEQAMDLLQPMGMLLVCVYPGHPEGERERDAVTELFSALSPRDFNVLEHRFPNAGPGAPLCFAVQKQRKA